MFLLFNELAVCKWNEIDEKFFFDYKTQKMYSNDLEKWSIYCSLGFRGFRESKAQKPYFFQIIYYIFSQFVKVYHIPRLIKLRFLKGKGKQNYT